MDPLFSRQEGQLAVDVIETPETIIIRTAIAGVTEEDLTLHVNDDVVTIKGTRGIEELPPIATTHVQECFWGPFSRTIMLPCSINTQASTATLERGILTLSLPKSPKRRTIPITSKV